MSILRRFVAPALAATALFATSVPALADGKIAVVDVQRAVMQTEDGLRAVAQLKKIFEAKQQQVDAKQREFMKQRDDLEKQAKVLSQSAMQKRQEDLQRQIAEFQGSLAENQKEIDLKQKQVTDPIVQKILAIVDRMAKSEGYDVVIDRATAHFVRADLDITDRCIQAYNAAGKGAAPAPAPAPAAPKN